MALVFEQYFEDVEALYHSESARGWEGMRLQIGRGPLNLKTRIAILEDIEIHWFDIEAPMQVRESFSDHALCVGLALKADCDLSLFGKPFEPQQALVQSSGKEVDYALGGAVATVGFFISGSALDQIGVNPGSVHVQETDGALRDRVISRAQWLTAWLAGTPSPDPDLLRLAEERLVADLSRLLVPGDMVRQSVTPQYRALNLAIDMLSDQTFAEAPNMAEIAHEAGVSERTLYRLFDTAFGVGPYEYFLRRRMSQFRDGLSAFRKAPNTRGAVTRAAIDAGFTHLGRFSQQYRTLFCESPKDTLVRWRGQFDG